MVLIGISCTCFTLETLPQFQQNPTRIWQDIETVCMAFFTVELVLRLGSCPDLGKFFKGVLNIVDILAIIPFYVELALLSTGDASSTVFRVLRLVRVFRVFKVGTWGNRLVNQSPDFPPRYRRVLYS